MLSFVIKVLVVRSSLTLARKKDIECSRASSWKMRKSAIHEHISSCKDSCSISNFYTLAQAGTRFEAKIKEALYIKNIDQN